jgi:hypothetical protein
MRHRLAVSNLERGQGRDERANHDERSQDAHGESSLIAGVSLS